MDEQDLERQRAAYAVQGVDESDPVQIGKKRKKSDQAGGNEVYTLLPSGEKTERPRGECI